MPIYMKTGSSTWSTMKSVYAKTNTSTWSTVKEVYAKLATGWQKIWPGNAPSVRLSDPINIRLTSYNGSIASGVQYLDTKLYGNDGSFDGDTPITVIASTRRMSAAPDNTGSSTRVTVVSSDVFDMSAASQATIDKIDGKYLHYELTAENSSGSLEAFSPAIKIIKRAPTINATLTGSEAIYEVLSLNVTAPDYYYNRPEYANSYVRWWRNTSKSPGGTIIQTHWLDSSYTDLTINTQNGVTFSATSDYQLEPGDLDPGVYIVAEFYVESSWARHNNTTLSVYKSTGDRPSIQNVTILDSNGNSAYDNQSRHSTYGPRVPVDTQVFFKANVSNAKPETTYRYRYRIYNNSTDNYHKPSTGAIATASASWDTYASNGGAEGYIYDVGPIDSNGSVVVQDWITLDPVYFNGGTYNDGLGFGATSATWTLEVEISAYTAPYNRAYWLPPFNYESFDLSRGMNPSIVVDKTGGSTPLAITASGTINGSPTGASYPYGYIVDWGDGSSNTIGYYNINVANPTWSATHTYNTEGTFYPTIDTIPSSNTNYQGVSVVNLAPPTLSSVTWNGTQFTLSYSGGSGPWFQFWYQSNSTYPTTSSHDSGMETQNLSTFSWTPGFTPVPGQTYYFFARSALTQTAGTTGVDISSYSTTYASVKIPAPATSPTSVTASNNNTYDTITVSWSGASNAAYYRVYWNTAAGAAPVASVNFDKEITATNSTSGSWAWGPLNRDKNGYAPDSSSNYWFWVSASADGINWSTYVRTSVATGTLKPAPSQITAPSVRATATYSTSTVYYGDSITWAAGTYNYASSVTTRLLYSTSTANISPGQIGNTSTTFVTNNPYTVTSTDVLPPAYYYAVRDTVVGLDGNTYYYFTSAIASSELNGTTFSYGTATSSSGGWSASINSGAQSGSIYSLISSSPGSATVNSSTGAISASGLSSGQQSTVTVSKKAPGYKAISASGTGTAATAALVGSISAPSVSASRTASRQITGTWGTSTYTNCTFTWYNTRVRNTSTQAVAKHTLYSVTPRSDVFTSLSGTSYRFGLQIRGSKNDNGAAVYSVGSTDEGAYTENGSNINPA